MKIICPYEEVRKAFKLADDCIKERCPLWDKELKYCVRVRKEEMELRILTIEYVTKETARRAGR